jgi:hypothetical protein
MLEIIEKNLEYINTYNLDSILTIVLVAWGSILSTIIFLQDRPRIKVGLTKGSVISLPSVDSSEKILRLSIRNYGRRPLTVSSVAFGTDKPKNKKEAFFLKEHFFTYDLPKELPENSEISLVMKYDSLKSYAKRDKVNINYLVFSDTLGKNYKAKISWRKWPDLKCNKDKNIFLKLIDKVVYL